MTTMNKLPPSIRFNIATAIAPYWQSVCAGLDIEVQGTKNLAMSAECRPCAITLIQRLHNAKRPLSDLTKVLKDMGKDDVILIYAPLKTYDSFGDFTVTLGAYISRDQIKAICVKLEIPPGQRDHIRNGMDLLNWMSCREHRKNSSNQRMYYFAENHTATIREYLKEVGADSGAFRAIDKWVAESPIPQITLRPFQPQQQLPVIVVNPQPSVIVVNPHPRTLVVGATEKSEMESFEDEIKKYLGKAGLKQYRADVEGNAAKFRIDTAAINGDIDECRQDIADLEKDISKLEMNLAKCQKKKTRRLNILKEATANAVKRKRAVADRIAADNTEARIAAAEYDEEESRTTKRAKRRARRRQLRENREYSSDPDSESDPESD